VSAGANFKKISGENYDVNRNTKKFEINKNLGLNLEKKQIEKNLEFIINKDKTLETFFENRLEFADEDQMWVEDIFEDTLAGGLDLTFGTQRDFINKYVKDRNKTLG
jgi:hypothetical protein